MIHTVAVLRGGPSSEAEVSRKSGRSVIDVLGEKYKIKDISIDKDKQWFVDGIQYEPHQALRHVDVVFNALHGAYGEDGEVQRLLEHLHIPFTGPKALAAGLSMHKAKTKDIYAAHGIKTPEYTTIQKGADAGKIATHIVRDFRMPVVVKPVSGGSSIGIALAHDFQELKTVLEALFEYSDILLIEEYIQGKEGTVGVIEHFRDQHHYPLLPTEIRLPKEKKLFDYEAKYSGDTEEICPGNFSSAEKQRMQHFAVEAHKALGLRHYSRTDFIIHPTRGVFALETNALPGLTAQSLLPQALEPVGLTYPEFLEHIIQQAAKSLR